MADQVNYYEVLGVPRNASQSEIEKAYRSLAKKRHPDHPNGSAEAFSLLQEAHAVLADPNRRSQHDEALDLAYAADQLSGLDFDSLDDELSGRRRQREASSGPGLGERLRGRFGRKQEPASGGRGSSSNGGGERRRGRFVEREARWYEPHDFEPEPVTWASGATSFVAAFVAFIVVGQLGLWATGAVNPGFMAWLQVVKPVMPLLYLASGILASYFAYRAAGYVAVALVFIAALVVGGSGGPVELLQYVTFGIVLFLVWIYLGARRDRMARERR
ncbi:MAG: J domain-containing protein [Rubrobacteraceae bacterium]